jgi:Domain of unknown function (DUF4062)
VTLIIDLTAANRTVADDDFRDWAGSQTLFLSSVMGELKDERRAVAVALESEGFTVRWFEDFGGTDDPPDAAYLTEVAAADIYVGLMGDDYGTMHATGFSATHEEYLEARRRGKRVTFWARNDGSNRDGHARNFVSEVRVFNVTGGYSDADDLVRRLVRRLREMAAEDVSPWVKVGDIIFRAQRITEAGQALTIDASVRDANVMHALRALAPGPQFGRGADVPVSYRDRAGVGRIESIEVQTQSQTAQNVKLVLAVRWSSGRPSTAMTTVGFSHEDLVEIGIRAGLLHEPVPQSLTGFGMTTLVDTADPLAALEGVQLAEGSVGPVARLLVVDHLVGKQRVDAIEDFVLGPAVQGRRHLDVAWREYAPYTNRAAGRREIEGDRPWG